MREMVALRAATCGEADHAAGRRIAATSHHSSGWEVAAMLLLCIVCILASAKRANAQCSARDVLQRQLTHKTASPVSRPKGSVTSISDLAGWKTITIGNYPDRLALLTALSAIGCSAGDSAAAILVRPAFTVSGTRTVVELLTVSAAELGLKGETASLRQNLRTRAATGLRACPARNRSSA